ncbi:hypothetical protein A5784_30705 [Mycobacterium sp. 852013-50091_SCH5140682]|uniref:hypothetical protein n=1 Tax=Mycobacterium sp. 852013-50091_SCH5140682 TaxID=1834109 RepID=UPI0007EB22B5|nr:hypothetical protein [Mycobacterium sp. 852013-50091_SCH5140682]OBC14075.1 hypothetical protein A5784_30705 [Mycobacterium sp. 852013-50091_SCH5140682]
MSATSDLLAQLERHYIKPSAPMPGGVFLPEVGQNGGWGSGSRADAVYVGFTSSSGRILIGHELKISRSDWLNELNKPGKADAWADECHEWWLVVNDPAIVHEHELPAGWGLMSPSPRSKNRMQVHTPAVRKDPRVHRPAWNAVRSIMARQDTLRAQAAEALRRAAREDARRDFDKQVAAAVDRRLAAGGQHDATQIRERLTQIEQALGAKIDFTAATDRTSGRYGWSGEVTLAQISEIAAAVRAFGDVQRATSALTDRWANPVKNTQGALDRLGAALTELGKAGRPAKPPRPAPAPAVEPPSEVTRPSPDLFSEIPL